MDVHELAVDGCELTLIDDSYNANLDSMRAGIAALASIGQGRPTVAVLGEMLELGEDSRSLHEQVGAMIEEAGVDALVGLGANAHYYLEGSQRCPPPRGRVGSLRRRPPGSSIRPATEQSSW